MIKRLFEFVKDEFAKWDVDSYDEIVFCGFGEPSIRLYDVLEVAQFIKEKYNKTIRINTNGLANLYFDKDVTSLFKDKIDIVSISLNTPNKEKYYELTRNRFGVDGFDDGFDDSPFPPQPTKTARSAKAVNFLKFFMFSSPFFNSILF